MIRERGPATAVRDHGCVFLGLHDQARSLPLPQLMNRRPHGAGGSSSSSPWAVWRLPGTSEDASPDEGAESAVTCVTTAVTSAMPLRHEREDRCVSRLSVASPLLAVAPCLGMSSSKAVESDSQL